MAVSSTRRLRWPRAGDVGSAGGLWTLLVVAALLSALVLPAAGPVETPAPVAVAAPVLTGATLQGSTAMQSFAYDPSDRVWIFAQVTDAYPPPGSSATPANQGDLTLTRVSSRGRILGHMYLTGFGHGVSIAVEPVGRTTYLWTEAVATLKPNRDATFQDAFGTKIARFAWQDSSTVAPTSPGVELFGVNAGTFMQTPSFDLRDGLIAVEYWNPSVAPAGYRYAVYRLADFKQHHYDALYRVSEPLVAARGLLQGWALSGPTSITVYTGAAYSRANPRPGDAEAYTFDRAGVVRSTKSVAAGTSLSHREPEGVTTVSGRLCYGFASGAVGARRANVYCQAAPAT